MKRFKAGTIVRLDPDIWDAHEMFIQERPESDNPWIVAEDTPKLKQHYFLLNYATGAELRWKIGAFGSAVSYAELCPIYHGWLEEDKFLEAARRAALKTAKSKKTAV